MCFLETFCNGLVTFVIYRKMKEKTDKMRAPFVVVVKSIADYSAKLL